MKEVLSLSLALSNKGKDELVGACGTVQKDHAHEFNNCSETFLRLSVLAVALPYAAAL